MKSTVWRAGASPRRTGRVVGELLLELAHAARRIDDADELSCLCPLAHVGVRPAGDRPAPHPVGGKEGVGEGDVHPPQQVRIRRRIRCRAVPAVVRADDPTVHAAHPRALAIGGRAIAERHDGQPLRGAGQSAERVGFVPRVLHHSGQGGRVQRLHQQGPHSPDDRRQGAVHGPRRRARAEVALVRPVAELAHPLGRTAGISGHDAAKARCDRRSGGVQGAWHVPYLACRRLRAHLGELCPPHRACRWALTHPADLEVPSSYGAGTGRNLKVADGHNDPHPGGGTGAGRCGGGDGVNRRALGLGRLGAEGDRDVRGLAVALDRQGDACHQASARGP